jgi:Protein of unknown function (DUF3383)
MPSIVTPQIPANQLVNIAPGVLSGGGQPLQFNGLMVDSNLDLFGYPLMPVGQLLSFADETDVSNYFGATAQETGLADVYFTGPINATKQPNALLASFYALNAVPAFLRGGALSLTLAQLQTVNTTLTVTIDNSSTASNTVNLSTATSFSNAANLIGSALALTGTLQGTFQAALSTTTMTVSAFTASNAHGPLQATVTATLTNSSTAMVVSAVTGGYLQVGQVVTGTDIPAGTTIASYSGGGQPGGVGTYVLSNDATGSASVTVSAFAPTPTISIGDVVSGTGITAGTYISAFGTGTGGAGTYTLSTSASTEAAETIQLYAPAVIWEPRHNAFQIGSATSGASSAVSFASGAAATTLGLTLATGAVQSAGAAATNPATFMNSIIAISQNWVEFMTTWEPTDSDKEAFATWNNAQEDGYVYEMWETNVLDTESGGPSAPVAFINASEISGVDMIYTNPAITTLAGEKAAFAMSWAATLDFTRLNGRSTAAGKSYSGGLPDVTNGTVADYLGGNPQAGTPGYGVNFYGSYTTRTQAFPQWQRGFISGPFVWKDSYVNQIWLNNALQQAIMVGLSQVPSVPYNYAGYATIEAWCLDPILAAVNYGAIVAGVQLSQAQIQEVNTAAGLAIDSTLFARGWYLQVLPATAQTRALRASPPCTLWYCDGGSIQSINLLSLEIQ